MAANQGSLDIIGAQITEWWGRNRTPLKIVALLVVTVAAVSCYAFPKWGQWPPSRAFQSHVWKTQPANGADHQVLTTLLTQNREEVRFWQNILFNVSLAFIAGILGIVSLALKVTPLSEGLQCIYAAAVVFLCGLYLTFVSVGESAIALNHHDLTAVEIALNLATKGAYIQEETIYDHSEYNQTKRRGETFVQWLVLGSISLGVLSVGAVLFVPDRHAVSPSPVPAPAQ